MPVKVTCQTLAGDVVIEGYLSEVLSTLDEIEKKFNIPARLAFTPNSKVLEKLPAPSAPAPKPPTSSIADLLSRVAAQNPPKPVSEMSVTELRALVETLTAHATRTSDAHKQELDAMKERGPKVHAHMPPPLPPLPADDETPPAPTLTPSPQPAKDIKEVIEQLKNSVAGSPYDSAPAQALRKKYAPAGLEPLPPEADEEEQEGVVVSPTVGAFKPQTALDKLPHGHYGGPPVKLEEVGSLLAGLTVLIERQAQLLAAVDLRTRHTGKV